MPIYKKLLEFQKLGIKVSKDATNPHFKSKYSSLNHVLETIKPDLTKMGVLILQTPYNDERESGLITKLIDTEDDSFVEGHMPYTEEAKTAQKLGAHNTYNRRFSLVTMLNLEDEDDDGNSVSAPVKHLSPGQADPASDALNHIFGDPNAELDAMFNDKIAEMPDVVKDHGPTVTCKTCGKVKSNYVPGGVSKKTGKPYNGFYACPDGHKDY